MRPCLYCGPALMTVCRHHLQAVHNECGVVINCFEAKTTRPHKYREDNLEKLTGGNQETATSRQHYTKDQHERTSCCPQGGEGRGHVP